MEVSTPLCATGFTQKEKRGEGKEIREMLIYLLVVKDKEFDSIGNLRTKPK